MFESIISVVAPHTCVGCGAEGAIVCEVCLLSFLHHPVSACYRCKALSDDYATCPTCRRKSSVKRVWVAARYEGLGKELIRKYKFERACAAGKVLGKQLADVILSDDYDVVCPIPPDSQRYRMRGYNPPGIIAKHVARQLKIPYAELLGKQGHKRQVGQSAKKRRQQLANAFYSRHPRKIENKKILLIDDVISTGATLEAAAAVLDGAGAKRVEAAVFARP
jgi:ComF family protein